MTRTIRSLTKNYLASEVFARLSPSSQRVYSLALDTICEDIGHLKVTSVKRKHGVEAMDRYADRPGKANTFVSVLSILMNYALDRDWIDTNPIRRIKPYSQNPHSPWPDDAISVFKHGAAGDVRRAFYLCLYTAQRIGDVLRMKWADIREDMIEVTQEKTNKLVFIPIHEDLKDEMTTWEHRNERIVPADYHEIYRGVQRQARSFGLSKVTIHGLRKNAMIALAEAGCSEREIMSISGHDDPQQVSTYVAGAQQKKLAQEAMRKLQT